MSTLTGFLTLQRLAKGFFAVLAVLAVTVALASPICDAYEVPGVIHEQGCCATLNDGNLVALAALPSNFEPPVLGPVPVAWSPEWRATAWPAHAIPPDRPPLTWPYHARSARILI